MYPYISSSRNNPHIFCYICGDCTAVRCSNRKPDTSFVMRAYHACVYVFGPLKRRKTRSVEILWFGERRKTMSLTVTSAPLICLRWKIKPEQPEVSRSWIKTASCTLLWCNSSTRSHWISRGKRQIIIQCSRQWRCGSYQWCRWHSASLVPERSEWYWPWPLLFKLISRSVRIKENKLRSLSSQHFLP